MRVKSITLYPIPGNTFVQSSDIAFAVAISIKRSGGQAYLNDGALGNNDAYLDAATGRVYVPAAAPFENGETVFVIYSDGGAIIVDTPPVIPEEPPVPPSCAAPTSVTVTVNLDNTVTVMMPEMHDYRVSIITSAGTCGISVPVVSGTTSNSDIYTSPVLAVGTYKACVYRNCGVNVSGYVSSAIFNIVPIGNMGVRKVIPSSAVKIISVTGFTYSITSGAFPLTAANASIVATHSAFSATITVKVQVPLFFTIVVAYYRNNGLVQYKKITGTTSSTQDVTFVSGPVASSDTIFINLDYS